MPVRKPCVTCRHLFEGPGSHCPAHARPMDKARAQRKATARRERKQSGTNAQSNARRALNKQGWGTCAHCRNDYTSGGIEIDHIQPLKDGGLDVETNIQALCIRCHQKKTAEEAYQRSKR
jgi:5-methylcytosine-specific restriction protein A